VWVRLEGDTWDISKGAHTQAHPCAPWRHNTGRIHLAKFPLPTYPPTKHPPSPHTHRGGTSPGAYTMLRMSSS
jgi:hypothetical protein